MIMSDILKEAKDKILTHEYSKAAELYNKYLENEKNKSDPEIWAELGSVLQKQKDYYKSIDAFGNAVDLQPENPEYYYKLGSVLMDIHNYAEARVYFEKAAELSDDIKYKCKVGDSLGYLREYDKALVLYNLLLTKHPDTAEIYCRLAKIQKHLGRLGDSVKSKEKEMEIRIKDVTDNPNAETWYKYADINANLHIWDKAKYGFEKSLEFEDSADTHLRLAAVLAEMNDETAEAEFEKAEAIDPKDFDFIMTEAEVLCKLNMYDLSIKYYIKALDLKNVHADAWAGIAYNLLKLGRKDEAKAFFEMGKATVAVPQLPWADKLHKSYKTEALDKELS